MLKYVDLTVVVIIETLIMAGALACIIFLLVPVLNDFFEGDGKGLTAISPTDIGLTVPEGDTPTATGSLILVAGSAGTALWATHGLLKFTFQTKEQN